MPEKADSGPEEVELKLGTKVEKVGPCKMQVAVEIPVETVTAQLEQRFETLREEVAIPGFRPGRAPRKLLERKFGTQVRNEVKMNLLNRSYEQMLEEQKLEPVKDPELDFESLNFKDGEPLAYSVTLEVRPTIEPKNYLGVEVERPRVEVTDEEVDKAFEQFRRTRAELLPLEEAAVATEGDVAVTREELWVGDKQVVSHENVPIVLEENISVFNLKHPGLKDTLVGKKAGDTVEVDIRTPPDFYEKEHRDKEARLRVTILELKRQLVPDATDEWAKELDFDSLEQLRERVRAEVEARWQAEAAAAVEERILERLIEQHEVDLPESLIEGNLESTLKSFRVALQFRGVPEEDINKQVEERKQESVEYVTRTLKGQFLLEAIGGKEKLYVTEDEVDERMKLIAERYGKWPNELRQQYERDNMMSDLRRQLRYEKVRSFLRSKARVTEEAGPAAEQAAEVAEVEEAEKAGGKQEEASSQLGVNGT